MYGVVAMYGCLCYQNSKYLKNIHKKRNRMVLNWEDIQDIYIYIYIFFFCDHMETGL